jgi:hypothetical protein
MANVAGRILLIVAALVLAPKNVSADWWPYTKWDTTWGMTPDQALAASKGALKKCDAKGCGLEPWLKSQAQLRGTYEYKGFSLTGFAYFDNSNALRRIHLSVEPPEKKIVDALGEGLFRRYGPRHGQTKDGTFRYWRLGTDKVRLYTGVFISIHYEDPSEVEP